MKAGLHRSSLCLCLCLVARARSLSFQTSPSPLCADKSAPLLFFREQRDVLWVKKQKADIKVSSEVCGCGCWREAERHIETQRGGREGGRELEGEKRQKKGKEKKGGEKANKEQKKKTTTTITYVIDFTLVVLCDAF